VIGISIPSFGTFQFDQGNENVHFSQLIRGVLPYFGRVLGIVLVVWVGMFLAAFLLIAFVFSVSVLTLGIGLLCVFPLAILLILMVILGYALMEQAVSAVLVDNLGVSSALRRAWDLIKKNPGVMTTLSLISYLVAIVAILIISTVMMFPVFGSISNAGSGSNVPSFEGLSGTIILWMLVFLFFYAVFQGILLTFLQSVWTLIYLRLTRSITPSQPLSGTVEAKS